MKEDTCKKRNYKLNRKEIIMANVATSRPETS